MKVLIVGGVAGGASAAARLRRLNEKAEIILLERGGYISFANCGLPYYIGGEITDQSALTLQTPQDFSKRFRIDVRIYHEAVAIDPNLKKVTICRCKTSETYEEGYDKLILSPGAFPIIPPLEGADLDGVFTLRNIPDTIRIKNFIGERNAKKALVVGGGYIGIEMAENLSRAGLKVSIAELGSHVINSLDYDMACEIHHHLRENGIGLFLNRSVRSIRKNGDSLFATLSDGTSLKTDIILLSAGVRPDTKFAAEAGLEVNGNGAIIVDEHMRTSDENIYAVGDAVEITEFVTGDRGYIPLAGPANKQGRIAADNICGFSSSYKSTLGASILKVFDITAAAVGLNEASALRKGIDYGKVYTLSQSHASYYPGGYPISIKTLFDKSSGKILGVQLIGQDGVDKRADVFATAIRARMTAFDLTDLELCYAPPYGSAKDPVNFVGYVIENVLTEKAKHFFWEDVDKLPRDGSVTLLDVRTNSEVSRGMIEGFRHIPLDELRQHIEELEKDKPIYINCQSGLRSYLACRILTAYGFDCYTLSGGWRLYHLVMDDQMADEHGCYDLS